MSRPEGNMKNVLLAVTIVFVLTLAAHAQTECPSGLVCITPAAARKALVDADTVKAMQAEKVENDKAMGDLRELLGKMRVQFAEVSGELTALKQSAVQDRAVIEILLKNTKKRCLPFSVCIN